MRTSKHEKLIKEGEQRIHLKEELLYREQQRSDEAERYTAKVSNELSNTISTGLSFTEVMNDLGVSLSAALTETFRRMAGKQRN